MKKKFLSCASLFVTAVLGLSFAAACGGKEKDSSVGGNSSDNGNSSTPSVSVPDLDKGYTYNKQNGDGLMQFYSSDGGLDEFLNDYMRRHLRYDDDAVGDLKVGQGSTVWREWDAMSVMWMNTAGIGYSPKSVISNWISSIYQDAFGYIWVDNGTTTTDWGQSWEFPGFGHSYYGPSEGERIYLNTSYLNGTNNINDYKNGSNELSSVWKAVSDTGVEGKLSQNMGTGYYDALSVSDSDLRNVTFTYERPENDTIVYGGENYEVKPLMATPFCAPFLELDFSITDRDSLGSTDQVEDIIVSWKGGSDEKNAAWDAKHSVRYSEFSTNYKEKFSSATHIVFPMYANRYWGTSEELEDAITDMKIEVVFKNGINADVRLEEVTLTFDGRQINNNSIFVTTAAYYYQYSQDDEWLAANLDKIRAAMQFLFTYCGSDGADTDQLITTERLVGHDGSTNYDYWSDMVKYTGTKTSPRNFRAVGHGIGDGYWDCVNNPCINLYTNLYYYKALEGMLYLERMAKAASVEESGKTVSVRPADMGAAVAYSETAESLQKKAEAFVPQFRDYFWNETTGRFDLGYLPETDPGVKAGKVGTVVDYGFTAYNQEAVELGLASTEQAKSIADWINGARKVDGDTADNSSTAKQIYRYEFAPRWTTKENTYQYWFRFSGDKSGSYGWNKQIQNGGTAIHCAYFDLVSENAVNGADASFAKLKNIENWYNRVKEAGGSGKSFYRDYYEEMGIKLQGGPSGSGVLGLDYEFIEATLMYASVPTAYFGLSSTEYKTLDIRPSLPGGLTYWKMENLAYGDIFYDLTIGDGWVQINSIQGNADGLKLRVVLDAPEGNFEVRQHNAVLKAGTDYKVEGGKLVVEAPFRNGRIQTIAK